MHFIVTDAFYSLNSRQHVSAGIAAIFRVMLLLQEYKGTNVVTYKHFGLKGTGKKLNLYIHICVCVCVKGSG